MSSPSTDALAIWFTALEPLLTSSRQAERIRTVDAVGRVLTCEASAVWSLPESRLSAMDGVAVDSTHPGLTRDAGSYDVVDTGDVIADRYDCVVKVEDCIVDRDTVHLAARPRRGTHVRQVGEDVAAGEALAHAGQPLTAATAALLLAAGVNRVDVVAPPRVTIIPTGDEVVPVGQTPARGQILETNSFILSHALREAGAVVDIHPVVADIVADIENAVSAAAARSELIVTIAGSGKGRDDHMRAVIESLGAVSVHGVRIRPGHPVILGAVRSPDGRTKAIAALPGYPVAAMTTNDLFVLPLVDRLLRRSRDTWRPVAQGTLTTAITSTPGVEEHRYVRVSGVQSTSPDSLLVTPLPTGSSRISTLARADGIITIPAHRTAYEAGETVDVVVSRSLSPQA